MLHAKFGDLEILGEVQLEDIDRIADIKARVGHRHQIDNHIVLSGQTLQFFLIRANIEMDEVDVAALHRFVELLAFDIEGSDFVLPVADETLGEIRANESTGT